MIKVNGTEHPWRQGLNITELLKEKNYVYHAIIVRINEKFVPGRGVPGGRDKRRG